MFKRFLVVTFFVFIIAFFISPFCIIYLILNGYPEPAVDYCYWGMVVIIWLIIEMIAYLEWRVNKDE